jgi:hypothetical protein
VCAILQHASRLSTFLPVAAINYASSLHARQQHAASDPTPSVYSHNELIQHDQDGQTLETLMREPRVLAMPAAQQQQMRKKLATAAATRHESAGGVGGGSYGREGPGPKESYPVATALSAIVGLGFSATGLAVRCLRFLLLLLGSRIAF